MENNKEEETKDKEEESDGKEEDQTNLEDMFDDDDDDNEDDEFSSSAQTKQESSQAEQYAIVLVLTRGEPKLTISPENQLANQQADHPTQISSEPSTNACSPSANYSSG